MRFAICSCRVECRWLVAASFACSCLLPPARIGNLARSRGYDSPFIRSDWNSGVIYIRKCR